MGLLPPSPAKLRRHASERGANTQIWVPTFVDLGKLTGLDNVKMAYSFAVASASDLLFYECDKRLYGKRDLRDPFEHALDYNGRVPLAAVESVAVAGIAAADVTDARRGAFWSDLLWNKSLGAVFGVRSKSVAMAAAVVIQMREAAQGHSNRVVFGIPHEGDTEGGSFDFIGDLLPEKLGMLFELGSLALEYAETDNRDHAAFANAKAVAQGLLSLSGRELVIEQLAEPAPVTRARGLNIS